MALPGDRIVDCTSFLSVFEAKKVSRKRPLYWQFNWARGDAKVAIRDGHWKLVANLGTPDLKPSVGIAADEMHLIRTAN